MCRGVRAESGQTFCNQQQVIETLFHKRGGGEKHLHRNGLAITLDHSHLFSDLEGELVARSVFFVSRPTDVGHSTKSNF